MIDLRFADLPCCTVMGRDRNRWSFFMCIMGQINRISVRIANSEGPDQKLSDLDLPCLLIMLS